MVDRKITTCTECSKEFWYIDPRAGGRPRKKCGLCSSRPPRYPWDFMQNPQAALARSGTFSKEDSEEIIPNFAFIKKSDFRETAEEIRRINPVPSSALNTETLDSYEQAVIPSKSVMNAAKSFYDNKASQNPPQASSFSAQLNTSFQKIEQRLEKMENRLTQLEEAHTEHQQAVSRMEWVDLSARLDIVEQNTTQTLGKIRTRLDGFTKEVKQIAVIPEKELHEMYEVIKMIRQAMQPDDHGNRSR